MAVWKPWGKGKEMATRLRRGCTRSDPDGVKQKKKDVPGCRECRIFVGPPPLPLPCEGAMPIASKLEEDPKRLLYGEVKWKFDTNIFHDDILTRNVDQAPAISSVYKNKSIVPIIREEPVVTTICKKMPVNKQEPHSQNIRKQQSAVFKAHSVASHIYKSVYKQQATVPIVRKEQSIVSNIYRSQLIRPVILPSPEHFIVARVLSADSEKKLKYHGAVWNYRYNPHHSTAHDNVHVIPLN
ncbi:hypothetical protein ACFW04_002150 [Cataglyphis niger]